MGSNCACHITAFIADSLNVQCPSHCATRMSEPCREPLTATGRMVSGMESLRLYHSWMEMGVGGWHDVPERGTWQVGMTVDVPQMSHQVFSPVGFRVRGWLPAGMHMHIFCGGQTAHAGALQTCVGRLCGTPSLTRCSFQALRYRYKSWPLSMAPFSNSRHPSFQGPYSPPTHPSPPQRCCALWSPLSNKEVASQPGLACPCDLEAVLPWPISPPVGSASGSPSPPIRACEHQAHTTSPRCPHSHLVKGIRGRNRRSAPSVRARVRGHGTDHQKQTHQAIEDKK